MEMTENDKKGRTQQTNVAADGSLPPANAARASGLSIEALTQMVKACFEAKAKTGTDLFAGLFSDEVRAFVELHRGLDVVQAAAFLGYQPHTLGNWRGNSRGPEYFQDEDGGAVRYTLFEMITWRHSRRKKSTSDRAGRK